MVGRLNLKVKEATHDAETWRRIELAIRDTLTHMHPGVNFIHIWVKPCTSWCGGEMVDVWAIYDGDTTDLALPAKPSLGTLIQEILWNMDIDASPRTHLVAKADAKDLRPETV